MFISVFDIFKIGIGPTSSHTMGPMTAAGHFLDTLTTEKIEAERIQISLDGSLSFTGRVHATNRAILLGLSRYLPEIVGDSITNGIVETIHRTK